MKASSNVSRRRSLKSSSTFTGASLLRNGAPSLVAITQFACTAKQDNTAYKVLGTEDAANFAAIAARIIPSTGMPGAAEAGVIHLRSAQQNTLWLPQTPTKSELEILI